MIHAWIVVTAYDCAVPCDVVIKVALASADPADASVLLVQFLYCYIVYAFVFSYALVVPAVCSMPAAFWRTGNSVLSYCFKLLAAFRTLDHSRLCQPFDLSLMLPPPVHL